MRSQDGTYCTARTMSAATSLDAEAQYAAFNLIAEAIVRLAADYRQTPWWNIRSRVRLARGLKILNHLLARFSTSHSAASLVNSRIRLRDLWRFRD